VWFAATASLLVSLKLIGTGWLVFIFALIWAVFTLIRWRPDGLGGVMAVVGLVVIFWCWYNGKC